jgi:hypothetical protein
MMFKIREGLTLQESPKILVLSAGSFMGIRFSISRKAITHLIQSSGNPSLKIANCREYLEPQAVLSGSMRLQLDPLRLVRIRLINLIHLLHLGNKRNWGEGGCSCAQKEAKQRRVWKTYSLPLSGLKFFNRSVITVLYIESKIAIYDCHIF